jgi:hypothetical protein
MKQNLRRFTFCSLFAFGLMLIAAPADAQVTRLRAKSKAAKKLTKHDRIDQAMQQEQMLTRDPALGYVPRERLVAARAVQDDKLQVQAMNRAVPGISWAERGSNNVGGRTRGLIYDRNDATGRKVWAGGVAGGLWFTNDITVATPIWTKVNDFQANLAITTIAQRPGTPLTIYAGTGEGWFNIDAVRGLGIWKTTNGGTTWTQLASTNNSTFHYVQKVVVTTGDTVFACTSNGGLQRSVNGGTTWTTVLGNSVGGSTSARAADVEIASDGRIYCSMGIFNADGIYRSADRGATWTKIYTSAADEFRIELACAPNTAATVFAMLHNGNTNGLKKLMRSSNANAATPTWTNFTNPTWCDQGVNSTDFTRGQAWYDAILAVDPANVNTVYAGGVDIMRTTNGGTNWSQLTRWSTAGCAALPVIHADIHAIVFKPGSSTEFLAGTDGGIYRTTNSGTAFTARNIGYNVTQFYGVAMHPTLTNFFLAGAQDNGTQRFNAAGLNNTVDVAGGDGSFCHIDQDNGNIQITSYTFNNYRVSTDGGTTWANRFFANTGQFINPSDLDNTGNVLYAGAPAGQYFRWPNPATAASASYVTIANFGGRPVTHVLVSTRVANRVYFGCDDGRVVRVDNANAATPTSKIIKAAGGGVISAVAIDPNSATEDHILVTSSSYGVTQVQETLNANSAVTPTWASQDGDLPDMPVRWVIFDPRNSDWAIIATELGVWSTDNLNGALTDWEPTNTNLANVRTDHLQYRASDRVLAAATHGRGLYTATIPAAVRLATTNDIVVNEPVATDNGLQLQTKTAMSISLFSNSNDPFTAEVYDASGKLLKRATFNGSHEVDLSAYGKGMYIINSVNNRTKQPSSRKVVL